MCDSQPLVRQLPWQCSLYTNIRPSPYLVVSTYVEDTVIGRLILLTGSLQLPKRQKYLLQLATTSYSQTYLCFAKLPWWRRIPFGVQENRIFLS